MGISVMRRGALAATCLLAGVSAVACGLFVGDPHGRLEGDASIPDEASARTDASAADATAADASAPGDASGMPDSEPLPVEGGTDSGVAGPDGPVVCDAALDADPGNCGWCGHDCMGAACAGGACAPQIVATASPTGMVVDGTGLYYTTSAGVWRFDTATQQTQAVGPALTAPLRLAAHAPYLFFVTSNQMTSRMVEDGGGLTAVAGPANSVCLAPNSTSLYWWDRGAGAVYRIPVDSDGGATPVVQYPVGSPPAAGNGCVAADDRHLAIVTTQALIQRDLDSGAGATVTLSQPDTRYVLFVGAYTIVLTSSTDDGGTTIHVNAIKTGTTSLQEVASFPNTTVLSMVSDGTGFYWSPQGASRIDGCVDALCTVGVRHFSPPLTSPPTMLAVDPTFIYSPSGSAPNIIKFAH